LSLAARAASRRLGQTRVDRAPYSIVFVLLAGCGGQIRPSPHPSDGGPGLADASSDGTAEANDGTAEANDAPAEAQSTCEPLDAASGFTVMQYADYLCTALFFCTDAGGETVGQFVTGGTSGMRGCFVTTFQGVSAKQENQSCFDACMLTLGRIQEAQDAAACQGLSAESLPPECAAAFQ
jgi:hypothetical protein